MPENCTRCESCAELEADVVELNNKIQVLEHSCARMREAFLINDLGLPDYEGHRNGHKTLIAQAQVVDSYKQTATKRVIDWVVGGALALLLSGAISWGAAHFGKN